MELTITGTNDITYPILHAWDWRVDIYLYLGGLAAGLLIVSGIAMLRKWPDDISRADSLKGAMFAPFLLLSGMISIFLDLDRKSAVYWFYIALQPRSPMWWGAWAITITIPASFLYGLAVMSTEARDKYLNAKLKSLAGRLTYHAEELAVLNTILGISVGIYTGILLNSLLARPLWDSPVIPGLFLNSALCTGLAFMAIAARKSVVKTFFTRINIGVIFAEIILIVLFFYGIYSSSAAHQAAIAPFLSISKEHLPYSISTVLITLLFVSAQILTAGFYKADESESASLSNKDRILIYISSGAVLTGVMILRLAILYGGQLKGIP